MRFLRWLWRDHLAHDSVYGPEALFFPLGLLLLAALAVAKCLGLS